MIEKSVITQFEKSLDGALLQPGHREYDEARTIWNGMIDRKPGLIVKAAGDADVIRSVNFARNYNLSTTVKGGGHNIAGKAVNNGGLMVDLSLMRSVTVDPESRTARVEGGARVADLDKATQVHGLATTSGTDSRTGIAGLTLGGGHGYLARAYGLAIDNLKGLNIVTADGKQLHVSASEEPDLFWGLCGGGENLGIVTSFEFQLHKIGPQVMATQVFYPFEDAYEVLSFYRTFMTEGPEKAFLLAAFVNVPPVEPFPEDQHGRTAIALIGCYAGETEEGKQALAPIEDMGTPMVYSVDTMPYIELQKVFDASTPDGMRYYGKSQYLTDFPDEAVDIIVKRTENIPGAYSAVWLEPMGGAVSRVVPSATAFPHRNALFNFAVQTGWSDPGEDEELITWTREFHQSLSPFSTGGSYVNYMVQDDNERLNAAYGENLGRLRRVKTKYDPDNLFTKNIAPYS